MISLVYSFCFIVVFHSVMTAKKTRSFKLYCLFHTKVHQKLDVFFYFFLCYCFSLVFD